MSSAKFYQDLPSFSDFNGITEDKNFQRVPDDWTVIITDVKGSTKAIEAGRYRDVNTIGAAAIAAVQNATHNLQFPFVFGGDGATMVIPPDSLDIVTSALVSLKALSMERFRLELRGGMVSVKELVDESVFIEIAKHELTAGKCVAIFRGGGLVNAEEKVKGNPAVYQLPEKGGQKADLSGLSCRWQAIPSKRGKVLALLVAARKKNHQEIYQNILRALNIMFEGKIAEANPVNVNSMTYKSIKQCFQDERRYHSNIFSFSFILRFFQIVIAVIVFKFKVPPLILNPKKYANSMRTHSDYRKFDDMLRMILDCSADQIEKIKTFLEALFQKGEIFYGMHESDTSLMTCYVQDLDEGNHIHFIDGGNGGYAMAALQLKGQIRKRGGG